MLELPVHLQAAVNGVGTEAPPLLGASFETYLQKVFRKANACGQPGGEASKYGT
jgi:hypothetical protein